MGTYSGCYCIRFIYLLGPASQLDLTIDQVDLSTVNAMIQRPVYGWQCIQSYTVILQASNNETFNSTELVVDPTQLTYGFTFYNLDLCNLKYSATARASSTMSLPLMVHVNSNSKY